MGFAGKGQSVYPIVSLAHLELCVADARMRLGTQSREDLARHDARLTPDADPELRTRSSA